MHPLLDKVLRKRNILDPKELSVEEYQTFEKWKGVLGKEELTIEDLKIFLEQQVGLIEAKWKDYETSNEKKAEWIPYHTVYQTLLGAINSPAHERSALEQFLINLV